MWGRRAAGFVYVAAIEFCRLMIVSEPHLTLLPFSFPLPGTRQGFRDLGRGRQRAGFSGFLAFLEFHP